jgi:hypothetical protein
MESWSSSGHFEDKEHEVKEHEVGDYVDRGLLVAGFRDVVGCLWPSSDTVCVEVAKSLSRALRMWVLAESVGNVNPGLSNEDLRCYSHCHVIPTFFPTNGSHKIDTTTQAISVCTLYTTMLWNSRNRSYIQLNYIYR